MNTLERLQELTEIAENLISDEKISLPDGTVLTLEVNDDYGFSTNDFADCYGMVEWCHNTPGTERPQGFDGAARKIWVRHDCYWWQPPQDVVNNPEALLATRRSVIDLLEFGLQVVTVTHEKKCECCGMSKAAGVASLGGVEWYADQDYRMSVVADLVHELGVL